MRSLTWSRNFSSPSAARRVMVATVPAVTGVPNSSASAWAVRFSDRNSPDIPVEDDRGDPRPVPHWRDHALGCGAARGRPTRATAADELVSGHPHRDRWQVEHLTPFDTHLGRGPGPLRIQYRGRARAASARPDCQPAPTATPDVPADRPAYGRSYGAATSARAWQTASPTKGTSTSSGCSAPAGPSTPRSPLPSPPPAPSTPQPSPGSPTQPSEAARSPQQAPHRTDAHRQAQHHDRRTRRKINPPRVKGPDQLPALTTLGVFS